MKILYDPKIFYIQRYGGVSKYFINLSKEISHHHDARIVAPIYLNHYVDELNSSKIIKFLKLKKHYKNTRQLFNTINQNFFKYYSNYFKPDIVHLTYYENQLYFKKKSKIVLTIYDLIHEKFMDKYDFRYKKFSKKNYIENADKIICISNSCKKDLLEIYEVEEDKIDVVHLGIDLNPRYKVLYDEFLDKPYILYVGSRENYKNFINFIKAYSLSNKLYNNFNIVCFGGEDFNKKEIELLQTYKINSSKIKRFIGGDLQLNYIYKKANAYVCPSLYEGFGLTLLEAMAMNCPIISSNAGSLPEVGGSMISYFDPNNIEEMSYKIENLIYSEKEIIKQKEYFPINLKRFSWEKTAEKTKKIYEKIS
jgi:glycosyltransferase involved in cell wall biosynthesis